MTNPLEQLDAIKKYLSAADDVLKAGYMPDITTLLAEVTNACEAVQKAPKEMHDKCLPELIKVVEQMNAFEQRMRDMHNSKQNGPSS
ncbi:MAG: hypothetical protein WAO98_06495 [Alphaproteobacteria bacterium]